MASIVSIKLQKEPKLAFSNEITNIIAFDPKHVSNYLLSNDLGGNIDIDLIIDEMECSFINNSINIYTFGIKIEEKNSTIFIYATPINEKYKSYVVNNKEINVSSSNILCFMNVEDFKILFECDKLFIPNTYNFTISNKKSFQYNNEKFSFNNNLFEPFEELYDLTDDSNENFNINSSTKYIDIPIEFDHLFDDYDINDDNYFSDEDLNIIGDEF